MKFRHAFVAAGVFAVSASAAHAQRMLTPEEASALNVTSYRIQSDDCPSYACSTFSRESRAEALDGLREGAPVECRLQTPDGEAETLWLRHTYTENQIAWFRAGSALNLLH